MKKKDTENVKEKGKGAVRQDGAPIDAVGVHPEALEKGKGEKKGRGKVRQKDRPQDKPREDLPQGKAQKDPSQDNPREDLPQGKAQKDLPKGKLRKDLFQGKKQKDISQDNPQKDLPQDKAHKDRSGDKQGGKEKEKKLPRGRVMANNFYMLRMISRAAPLLIPLEIVTQIVSAVTNAVIGVYLFKYVLDSLSSGAPIRTVLTNVCLLFAASIANELWYYGYARLYRPIAVIRVSEYVQSRLQKKAAEVELSCYERPEFFDKFIKASDEASDRALKVLDSISSFTWALTSVLANGALVVSISPIFLPFSVAPALFTIIVGRKVNRLNYERDMKLREQTRRRDYVRRTFYLADYSKEMRLTDMKSVMLGKMRSTTGKLWDISTHYGIRLSWITPFVWLVPYWLISYLGTVLFAAYRTVVKGVMSVGDCFVVINSISRISGNLEWLFENVMSMDKHALYIENLRDFMNYQPSMPERESDPVPEAMETLTLRNVSFAYEGADKPTLRNVSLQIKRGEKIAIVGHNGAGKTTLVKLLMRLYDVTEGDILFNGQDIKTYRLSAYRNVYGTVFQDYGLFSVSVADNVLLRAAVTDEDRQRVREALEAGGAWERVQSLERGMDTMVTREFDQNGVVFSGGEAQKIAIARVFAGGSEIAILDEPSSALDPIAESKMYENMFRVCRDKTVIFISHRLSSATAADRIYLFENGEIAEQGAHAELLAMNGKYADMWHKQAQKYAEGEVEA